MDPLGFNPPSISAGGVGFNSLYRCGYSFVSPPCHPRAEADFGPSAIRQTEPSASHVLRWKHAIRRALQFFLFFLLFFFFFSALGDDTCVFSDQMWKRGKLQRRM